ncbi:hypothetical protein KGF56_001180 [Candida oxycetoniae]|uniref:Uncharacterized protein n=1 Tax=Candida oxycetoniae TaxID=497107 RepID=A0AAI9SZB2_9ASCO|nr:uncharacterized protein KGF56_001180 [Candida oxycetoniae]KAI3405961.2 hypothetical protein KGF56_001180 [Candida oxycetoniae]
MYSRSFIIANACTNTIMKKSANDSYTNDVQILPRKSSSRSLQSLPSAQVLQPLQPLQPVHHQQPISSRSNANFSSSSNFESSSKVAQNSKFIPLQQVPQPAVKPDQDRSTSTALPYLDIPLHPLDRDAKNRDKKSRNGKVSDTPTTTTTTTKQFLPELSRKRSATMPVFSHFESMRKSPSATLISPITSSNSSSKSVESLHPESPTWLLSDLLSNLSSLRDKDEFSIVQISNDLVQLFQAYPNLKDEVQIKTVLLRIQFMLYHTVSEVRSSCYRILRHLIVNYHSLILLVQSKILIFIIVSLSSDQSRYTLTEMEQALKLIRGFLSIERGADLLSVGVIKALIAIVESNNIDDHRNSSYTTTTSISSLTNSYGIHIEHIPEGFRNACLETICEIALLKPELIFHAGGFKLIIKSIIESPFEISSTCLLIVLRLLSFQNSRKFLRNGFDLDSLIAVFSTDESPNEASKQNTQSTNKFKKISNYKLQKISFLISCVLKDFNGLMTYSINDFTSIRNLLINLTRKNYRVQNSILDLLLDALRIQVFPWLQNSPIGEYLTQYNERKRKQQTQRKQQEEEEGGGGNTGWRKYELKNFPFEYAQIKEPFALEIVRHYQGLLAYVLIKNDIFNNLITIIEEPEGDIDLKKKATLLLTKLYAMANNLLPGELVSSQMQSLNLSAHISFELVRLTRSKFNSNLGYNVFIRSTIKQINAQANYNIDDDEFKSMINNTKILAIKEYEEWNWNSIQDFISGPLTNPKRFEEVLEKSPKLLKRLVSFYRPFKYRFSNISKSSKHFSKYITTGCLLLEMFLGSEVGIKYLAGSKLLPQVSETVAQVDPYSGISSNDPILGRRRLENTASSGYLRFIGILSSSPEGLELLSNWQFFTLLMDIVRSTHDSESRNYFIITLFRYIDFTVSESRFKSLLKMSFNLSNSKIKLQLLKNLIPRLLNAKECESLCIEILANNLYDSNQDIVVRSIEYLFQHYQANNFQSLETLLQHRPLVRTLTKYEMGLKFLVHFLTNPSGFAYLLDEGFLEDAFNKWFHIKKFHYVRKIDELIRQQFYPYVNSSMVNFSDKSEQLAEEEIESFALYFFKYLLSTEDGLMFFQQGMGKDFLDQLISSIEIIFNQINKDDEFLDIDNQDEIHSDLLNLLKQDLWIIGQIGSGKYGIQLLDPMYNINLKSSVIELIIDNFHNCSLWDVRGLCFYIIGMISTTVEGIEILDEFGWYSVMDQYGQSMSLAYPKLNPDKIKQKGDDRANLFNLDIVNPYSDNRYYCIFNSLVEKNIEENMSPLQRKIISHLQNLDAILSKIELKSVRDLLKLKNQEYTDNDIFDDVDLFLEVVRLIDKGTLAFHKRVFIFKLFTENTKVLENVLKKERKSSFKLQN